MLGRIKRRLSARRYHETVHVEGHVTLQGCQMIGKVKVGYRSYANDSLLRNVTIGRFCSIGRRCSIGAADHSMESLTTHFSGAPDGFESDKPTMFGSDIWVGDNVVILGGLTIGDGAVVAAGAVVVRDVAPYAIVGGVPARLIRYRFDPSVVEALLDSQWWLYGDHFVSELRNRSGGDLGNLPDKDRPAILASHFDRLERA